MITPCREITITGNIVIAKTKTAYWNMLWVINNTAVQNDVVAIIKP